MKALLLSLLIAVGLDEALDAGAGVTACCTAVAHLVSGTAQEVGGSVYRR